MESTELGPLSHRTSAADDVMRSRPKRTIKHRQLALSRFDFIEGDEFHNSCRWWYSHDDVIQWDHWFAAQFQETQKPAVDSVEYRKWRLQQKSSANLSNSHNGHSTVYFQFMYNNNRKQQTEFRTNLNCPWCIINCLNVRSLVKVSVTSSSHVITQQYFVASEVLSPTFKFRTFEAEWRKLFVKDYNKWILF